MMLSSVILAKLISMSVSVSTLCVESAVALMGLPASSVPVAVTVKAVSAARSLPATSALQLPSAATVALYH